MRGWRMEGMRRMGSDGTYRVMGRIGIGRVCFIVFVVSDLWCRASDLGCKWNAFEIRV
jgi:hypothetical protein